MRRNKKMMGYKRMISFVLAVGLAFCGSGVHIVRAEEEIVFVEEASDSESADLSSNDGFSADSSFEEELTSDVFVLDIEMAEDPGYVSEEIAIPEDIAPAGATETEMILLAESGEASCAGNSGVRMFSRALYTDSYGDQLSGESSVIYQAMKDTWAAGKTDDVKCTFSTPYTFTAEGTIEYSEEKGANVAVWNKEQCTEYQDVLAEMKYAVQSAFDAFGYDYPEVFWLGKVTFSYGMSFNSVADAPSQIQGKISSVTLCGVGEIGNSNGTVSLREKYEGAPGEISAFQSAVDAAVAEISNLLPENADTWDQVKAIHDYICNTVSYGENEYAHTAAGVFHKDQKVVVCEGYAKAMKILCRRFGITSALIVGDALKSTGTREAHMWNYIRMDDGSWYLVDATWDDQASGIRYVYFLAGAGTRGFNAEISTERQNNTRFSQTIYTMDFALPQLSEAHYYLWQTETEIPATCTTGSRITYQCSKDSTTKKTETGSPLGHNWDNGTVTTPATCSREEKTTYTCQREKCTATNTVVTGGILDHNWDSGTVTTPATCERGEETTYTCQWEGCTATETAATGGALGHNWDNGTVTTPATCSREEKTTYTCQREGCTAANTVVTGGVLDHNWDSGTVTTPATCDRGEETTYTCQWEGCTATKTAATGGALGHNWDNGTVTTPATCSREEKTTYTCQREGCKASNTVVTGGVSDHKWDSGRVTTPATCVKGEETTYTCQWEGCTATKTVATGGALGHEFSTLWMIDREATCTQTGEKSHHCTRCASRSDITAIPVIAHKWNGGKVTKAATCTEPGIKTYTCTVCKATKQKQLSALCHSYSSVWVVDRAATVLKTGIKSRICSRCGKKETKTIPKLKRTIQLNVTALPLQERQSTDMVKVTKMTKGDYIKRWESGNTRIVSVSKKGVITGKKAGKATITVVLASGAKASVKVTVQKKPVETTSLTVQGKNSEIKNKKQVLKKGKKETLVTKVTPLTSSDKITYSVSDRKIVTVSSKGVVTARKCGTAAITVKAGKKKVVLKVTVK